MFVLSTNVSPSLNEVHHLMQSWWNNNKKITLLWGGGGKPKDVACIETNHWAQN